MNFSLKPISKQVIVITGASSGIGLATARLAAHRGAKVVLASRNIDVLDDVVNEIKSRGGDAIAVATDVANPEEVVRVAERAIEHFGGFDTWVNNAGGSIYGKLTEVKLEEKRKLFDTDFWGVVHGCRAAVPHLKQRGGVIINMGSVVSDRAIPLQGIYSASKHAVKGYTDTLRMELEADGFPIYVTLVKPGAIDTPFVEHAQNHMEELPQLPPPIYDPRVVAEAILEAAIHPHRDIYVGASAKRIAMLGQMAPRMTDKVMEKRMFKKQKTNRAYPRRSGLFEAPAGEGRERGYYPGHVRKSSLYTSARLHPVRALVSVAGLAGAAWGLSRWAGGARQLTERKAA